MKSLPPDLMCPMQLVSYELFEIYYCGLENSDRYFHAAFSQSHGLFAIWHWRRGVWWTCETVNTLLKIMVGQRAFLDLISEL